MINDGNGIDVAKHPDICNQTLKKKFGYLN